MDQKRRVWRREGSTSFHRRLATLRYGNSYLLFEDIINAGLRIYMKWMRRVCNMVVDCMQPRVQLKGRFPLISATWSSIFDFMSRIKITSSVEGVDHDP